MKNGLMWYKCYPVDYLGGVHGLTAKEQAVYSILLNLMYQHGGSVLDNPKHVAGFISDMGTAAVRNAICKLVEKGKVLREGNALTNSRVKKEAKTRENVRKTAENPENFSLKSASGAMDFNDLDWRDTNLRTKQKNKKQNSAQVVGLSGNKVRHRVRPSAHLRTGGEK